MNGCRGTGARRAAGAAPPARSRAPRRSARAARRTAAVRRGPVRSADSGSSSVALRRSLSTASATPGYCTFTTTSSPSSVVARCTCPIEAAANARSSKDPKTRPTGRRAPRASASRAGERDRRDVVAQRREPGLQLGALLLGQPVELDHQEQLPDLHRRAAHPAELVDQLADEGRGPLVAGRGRPLRASGPGSRSPSPPSAAPVRSQGPPTRAVRAIRPVGNRPASCGGGSSARAGIARA